MIRSIFLPRPSFEVIDNEVGSAIGYGQGEPVRMKATASADLDVSSCKIVRLARRLHGIFVGEVPDDTP